MFILITTANFPDVMLAGYEASPITTLYFVVFLVLGLFLFMNMLIAVVYSSYQEASVKNINNEETIKHMDNCFNELFDKHCKTEYGESLVDEQNVKEIILELHGVITKQFKKITSEKMNLTKV